MHAFQSVATPFSSKDWADGEGTCEEHFESMKTVEKEVIGTIKINAIFLILHMLPLSYLGNFFFIIYTKYVTFVLNQTQHLIDTYCFSKIQIQYGFIGKNFDNL